MMDASECSTVAVHDILMLDMSLLRWFWRTGLVFRFAFGRVAVSPLDNIGWCPVSLTTNEFVVSVGIFFKIEAVFLKPKHF